MTVSIHLYPSAMVNESRLLRMSASLQASGAVGETHLVGTGGAGLDAEEDLGDGRRIVRLGGRRSRSLPGKLRDVSGWQWQVYRRYRNRGLAAVHAHSVWVLPLAWLLARRRHRAVLVYNPHELETGTPGMRGVQRSAARRIEGSLVRRADLMTVVNDSIATWYSTEYRGAAPIAVRNIPVTRGDAANLRRSLGVGEDELLYVHTGRLTSGRNIESILKLVPGDGRHIAFLGDGPLGSDVRAASASSRFVHWLPPVDADRVVDHVAEADIALCLIDTTSPSYRLSSPNKLFEALAASTPPLCTDLQEARALLGSAAQTWIMADINDLSARVALLTRDDVAAFRAEWRGLPTWDEEVREFVHRFAAAVGRRAA